MSLPMRLQLCRCVSPILLGRHSPGGDRVLCKTTDVTTRRIRLIGSAFTMTLLIWHNMCAMWSGSSVVEFWLCILWCWVDLPWGRSWYCDHLVVPPAWISLTLSRHSTLLFITSGRSSGLQVLLSNNSIYH